MVQKLVPALEEALFLSKHIIKVFPEATVTLDGPFKKSDPPVTLYVDVEVFKSILVMNDILKVFSQREIGKKEIYRNSFLFNGIRITCRTEQEWDAPFRCYTLKEWEELCQKNS